MKKIACFLMLILSIFLLSSYFTENERNKFIIYSVSDDDEITMKEMLDEIQLYELRDLIYK